MLEDKIQKNIGEFKYHLRVLLIKQIGEENRSFGKMAFSKLQYFAKLIPSTYLVQNAKTDNSLNRKFLTALNYHASFVKCRWGSLVIKTRM